MAENFSWQSIETGFTIPTNLIGSTVTYNPTVGTFTIFAECRLDGAIKIWRSTVELFSARMENLTVNGSLSILARESGS